VVSRGEVWWVDDPAAGRRPHLVLTRDAAAPLLNALIAVPATRTIRGIPTEVKLDEHDGMPAECVLSLDNVTLMPKAFFRERICALDPERMASVCRALGVATGCD
jgi:mRNA-degrading endonuclease toxin of MazEF toxin-antitoxin module